MITRQEKEVILSCDLGFVYYNELECLFEPLLTGEYTSIILNMQNIYHIDSSGTAYLLNVMQRADKCKTQIKLKNVRPGIVQMLKTCGLYRALVLDIPD